MDNQLLPWILIYPAAVPSLQWIYRILIRPEDEERLAPIVNTYGVN